MLRHWFAMTHGVCPGGAGTRRWISERIEHLIRHPPRGRSVDAIHALRYPENTSGLRNSSCFPTAAEKAHCLPLPPAAAVRFSPQGEGFGESQPACVPAEPGQNSGPKRGRRNGGRAMLVPTAPGRDPSAAPRSAQDDSSGRGGRPQGSPLQRFRPIPMSPSLPQHKRRSGFCRSFLLYCGLFPYRHTSSPFSTSTVMVAPGARSPRRMVRATRVSTLLCSTRRRGRAP